MHTTRKEQTITVNKQGILLRKAFRMKVNENLTNEEIRVRMKAMGLDFSKQKWSVIFKNIFYAGYFSHPFLNGDIIKGPHEPLVSLNDFLKINKIISKAHSSGYETKSDKEFAPLLGSLKCPKCGGNLTASVSTKMKKRYGKEIGYYVCSRKGCCCNVATKKANASFEDWLNETKISDDMTEIIKAQLRKAFPILNKEREEEVAAIKKNLTQKEEEIEQIEYNLATATTPKMQEICIRQLEKSEAERATISEQLQERNKEILNLDDYVDFGLKIKDNILKLWQLSNLSQKRHIQNMVFPNGLIWSKEKDHIEPLSCNEFLFVHNSKSISYEQKESGQTADFSNLSALAPPVGLEPTTL